MSLIELCSETPCHSREILIAYQRFPWVLNKNLLYCFLKTKYGERLNSGGTDSQIFIAENLNVDIP